ncbi:MAG: glycosyltransferase family 39 protein [Xanthobacteraceae bacterium]
MSATTDSGRRGLALIERLLAALTDPARRERTVVAVLLGYVAVWTLYGTLAKAGQDIHADMSEQFALGHQLALGYPKHPPLAMWVVRAWFAVFPAADWAYYLLAMANAGLALWIVWRLSARFLDGDKRVVGLALLTLVPFFNFHALKFNVNTVLLPLWAATTLWFLRSFETRRVFDAALAGLGAAAAMYGKYWSVFLLLGLGLAALADSRRAAYFRSPAPWVTIVVGALALAPHAAWLIGNDFAPFSYAVVTHGAASFASTTVAVLGYVAGSIAYVAVPLAIVFLVARPNRDALKDMAWPRAPERRLAALAFWAVLLAPAAIAPVLGVRLVSLWSMSAWTLLPVMLLSSPRVSISRRDAAGIVTLAAIFPVVMVALGPAIAFALHRAGPQPGSTHSSVLAAPVERLWRETTAEPLRLFSGFDEFTDGVAFYLPTHPLAVHVLDATASQAVEARIGRDGIALLCPARSADRPRTGACVNAAIARARCSAPGAQVEVEVSRRYLGIGGTPARYLIVTIPPMQVDKLPYLGDLVAGYAARRFKAAD